MISQKGGSVNEQKSVLPRTRARDAAAVDRRPDHRPFSAAAGGATSGTPVDEPPRRRAARAVTPESAAAMRGRMSVFSYEPPNSAAPGPDAPIGTSSPECGATLTLLSLLFAAPGRLRVGMFPVRRRPSGSRAGLGSEESIGSAGTSGWKSVRKFCEYVGRPPSSITSLTDGSGSSGKPSPFASRYVGGDASSNVPTASWSLHGSVPSGSEPRRSG